MIGEPGKLNKTLASLGSFSSEVNAFNRVKC